MIYKNFALLVFTVFFGVNVSMAQEGLCESIDEIKTAVENVMATSGCDEAMLWEAPNALNVHLEKFLNWCGEQNKPLKSKVPNIINGMLETIQDAYAGEAYTDPLTGEIVVVTIPAPDCALHALGSLEALLQGL